MVVSKKQAKFFGAVAGGKIKRKSLSASKAKSELKNVDMSKLPKKSKKK